MVNGEFQSRSFPMVGTDSAGSWGLPRNGWEKVWPGGGVGGRAEGRKTWTGSPWESFSLEPSKPMGADRGNFPSTPGAPATASKEGSLPPAQAGAHARTHTHTDTQARAKS